MNQMRIPGFSVRLAVSPEDLRAVQRLRYEVFADELGASGSSVDHAHRIEADCFDTYADHMIVADDATGQVIGVYRLMLPEHAARAGAFYSAAEFDLAPLTSSGRRLLELGRSCIRPEYRGGMAMRALWQGLARYVEDHGVELLFGVASFHGTDVTPLRAPLSLLHHRYLASPDLRVKPWCDVFPHGALIPVSELDRRAATVAMPSLIKAYLRLGAVVGEGAFVDHDFNTTDVCLILDPAKLPPLQAAHYNGGAG